MDRCHDIEQRLSKLRSQTICKVVQHYKQTSVIKSLSETRRTLPWMWLQPIKDITKHATGNDDREAIITKELKSHLKGLISKGKKKGTFGELEQLWLLDFHLVGSFGQKERDPPSKRERLGTWGKEFLNPETKRITNFYYGSERRKPTNNSHCDLLVIYIFICAHSIRRFTSNCTCNPQSHKWA